MSWTEVSCAAKSQLAFETVRAGIALLIFAHNRRPSWYLFLRPQRAGVRIRKLQMSVHYSSPLPSVNGGVLYPLPPNWQFSIFACISYYTRLTISLHTCALKRADVGQILKYECGRRLVHKPITVTRVYKASHVCVEVFSWILSPERGNRGNVEHRGFIEGAMVAFRNETERGIGRVKYPWCMHCYRRQKCENVRSCMWYEV